MNHTPKYPGAPYSAAPLTDDQRAEVLRVMSDTTREAQHGLQVHLTAGRDRARSELRVTAKGTVRYAELTATAAAYDDALRLLDACWHAPDVTSGLPDRFWTRDVEGDPADFITWVRLPGSVWWYPVYADQSYGGAYTETEVRELDPILLADPRAESPS